MGTPAIIHLFRPPGWRSVSDGCSHRGKEVDGGRRKELDGARRNPVTRLLTSAATGRLLIISIFVLFATGLFTQLSADAVGEMRTWTDRDGRQMEASLVKVEDGQVTILRADGIKFTVEASTFSEKDRAYIKEWQRKNLPSEPVEWPNRVWTTAPSVEIVEERGDTNIYRTEHFEFRSEARLSRTLVTQFGQIFEATFAAVQALPVGLDVEVPEEGHFVTRLFNDLPAYHRAGGVRGSGGIYDPTARQILVPIQNLGVKRSSTGFAFDRYRDNSTLIHEITHQVMHPWLIHLPVWLTEGFAVYMETIPYERGTFQFRQQDLQDHFEKTTGDRDASLPLGPLETLMNLDYRAWQSDFSRNRQSVSRNYYTAGLLTHYFLHLDGDGDARRLIRYLQALRTGAPEEEAREILLDGRTFEELEEDVITAFKRTGIDLVAP